MYKQILSIFLLLSVIFTGLSREVEELPLVAGDTISISVLNVFGESEFEFKGLKITNQPEVFIPRLGRVASLGRTGRQFIESVQQLARKKLYLRDADVEVVIDKVMHVDLQVKQDYFGSFEMPYGSSIAQFLGVHRQQSIVSREDFSNVRVLRSGSVYGLNLLQDEYARDFILRDGDQVVIQDLQANRSNSFYLVGNFSKPGRYSLDRSGYTLMDLLADAKGTLSEPKFTRRIYVFRKIGQERKVIEVDVRQLTKMGDLSQDIEIREQDVLLASVEKKIHTINKLKSVLERYIDIDSVFQQAELIRLFK